LRHRRQAQEAFEEGLSAMPANAAGDWPPRAGPGPVLLVGCGGYESDIGAVKKAQTLPGLSNDELVADLAGGRSTIATEAAPVEAGSGEVIEVVAVINRAGRSGMKHGGPVALPS
jgi:hypothetical protein